MNLEDSYCRLCAESKPNNKQLNLHEDEEKRCEIVEKLTRVNAATDFDEEILPKTVCIECVNSLNKAFDFVTAIEYAQVALNQLLSVQRVKKEVDSADEHLQQNSSKHTNNFKVVLVKKESDDQGADRDSDTSNRDSHSDRGTPPRKLKKPNNKKLDIDSIPLSQLSQLKLSWKNYSWYCTFCETIFSSVDELTSHSIAIHKMCNPYRCTDCKIRKVRLDRFLIHVQRHHKFLRYSCYKCFRKFKSTVAARKHKATHLTTKFTCPGCNTPFANNEELNKHMDDFCQSTKARRIPQLLQTDGLTCKVCQKSFKNKSALNSHIVIHTERKKDHTCEVCGKGFFLKYNLASHMVMHKDERPYKCQICSFAFKTARLLKNHVGVHNNDKPFTCSECGRCFRLLRQLTSHSIIHTDIHPYCCPHCQKRFRFKSILNNHVRLHTGVKPYSCEPCQRYFTNWSNYNKHMKRKHNTDTSKKKHTPDGLYPIDPNTGQVIVQKETNTMTEWKKMMLANRGLGRPRKPPPENIQPDTVIVPL